LLQRSRLREKLKLRWMKRKRREMLLKLLRKWLSRKLKKLDLLMNSSRNNNSWRLLLPKRNNKLSLLSKDKKQKLLLMLPQRRLHTRKRKHLPLPRLPLQRKSENRLLLQRLLKKKPELQLKLRLKNS